MTKDEIEFVLSESEWRHPPGAVAGVWEQLLSGDVAACDATVMQRYEPGTDTGVNGVIVHDYWEEVILLSGELTDVRLGATFTAGSYACRPPAMRHGPYRSERGCTMFVVISPFHARPRPLLRDRKWQTYSE